MTNPVQATLDYERIQGAIHYIAQNFTRQPGLKEIADSVHLSEYHFERLFSRWAGTSPQRFVRFLTKEYAKELLGQSKDLLEVTYAAGLSSPGRLHDLFVTYEAMSPGEYKKQAAGLDISYGFHPTPFGECLVSATQRGVCGLSFQTAEERETVFQRLRTAWPGANLRTNAALTSALVEQIFFALPASKPPTLLLKGTNFQIKVWEALLRIPAGQVTSYDGMAAMIGHPKACQAVGNAVGSNPVGYLIPCHRVIQKTGALGGYRWGTERKRAILAWEAARVQPAVPA
ncbi:MAG: bifunctional helix-turn-helix domain-containing protein/methylated-DNA--[protein]-cysteine S-methyltransferase [Ferruginibacter sp.]|nr:bifunctional helix-turn-helix domain-containing protein/methylated-DNA--[protein]-cysteine S-methyltransferase [Cytophagales bacterium]